MSDAVCITEFFGCGSLLAFAAIGMATIDLLSHTITLSALPREMLVELARGATQIALRRGETLWQAGDAPKEFTVIQKGLAKLVRHTQRGKAICGLFGAGETIDDLAVVRGTPHASDAIAASETVIVVGLRREFVIAALEREPRSFLALACSVEQTVTTLFEKIDVLSAGSVEARLATLLTKLNERFGDDFEDGTSEIPVALSRRDLAELVATSFETAIRVMSRWEREGLLETTRRGFTLRDVGRLATISGGTATAVAAE